MCFLPWECDSRTEPYAKSTNFCPKTKVIHTDIDSSEIEENRPVDVSVVGDAGKVISGIRNALVSKLRKDEDCEWHTRVQQLKEMAQASQTAGVGPMAAVAGAIAELVGKELLPLSDEVIGLMARSRVLCRHIHLPVQHGSDRVLERMGRRYTRTGYLGLVGRIRAAMPNVALSTDILGGSRETEDDHRLTLCDRPCFIHQNSVDCARFFQRFPVIHFDLCIAMEAVPACSMEEGMGDPDPAHALFRQAARSISGKPLKPSECSDFWFRRTLDFMSSRPLGSQVLE
jgi:hypothetical protein